MEDEEKQLSIPIEGFIKFPRRLITIKNSLSNDRYYRRFQILLAYASFKPSFTIISGKKINVSRGERFWSLRLLAEVLELKTNAVKTFLDFLQSEKLIEYKCTKIGTRVKILNYDDYQGNDMSELNTNQNNNKNRRNNKLKNKGEHNNDTPINNSEQTLKELYSQYEEGNNGLGCGLL